MGETYDVSSIEWEPIRLDVAHGVYGKTLLADGVKIVLYSRVGNKFGTSKYLVIVDVDTGGLEVVLNPGASGQRGAGMQAVVLTLSKNIKTVLTGYCSPTIYDQLVANGIEVIAGKLYVQGVK